MSADLPGGGTPGTSHPRPTEPEQSKVTVWIFISAVPSSEIHMIRMVPVLRLCGAGAAVRELRPTVVALGA